MPYQLFRRKDVILALYPLAVGVLAAAESALRVCELRQYIVQRAPDHSPVIGAAALLIRLQIGHCQQGVVVEHLLEVGHQPPPVGGIPGKAAAHMVEEPAPVHMLQGTLRHLPRPHVSRPPGVAEQEQKIMCSRELGGLAKAAPLPVKHPAKERRPGLHQLPFRYAGPGRLLPPEKFS